jgi:hypothetical protein
MLSYHAIVGRKTKLLNFFFESLKRMNQIAKKGAVDDVQPKSPANFVTPISDA